jgi:hypothetical protein
MLHALTTAILISTLGISAVQAADACLTPGRIFSWSSVVDRTILIQDRDKKQYVVKLGGVCAGLENPKLAISIATATQVSCVGPGDRIRFGDATFGPQICPTASIAPFTPPPAAPN